MYRYGILCLCLCILLASCNAVHFPSGSDATASDTEAPVIAPERFEGWFLRTDGDSVIFKNNEAVKIHIPTWEKDPSVRFDDLHNGDKIVVEVLQIGDTEPRDMPVYAIERLVNGSIANIADSVLTYLQELEFTVVDTDS